MTDAAAMPLAHWTPSAQQRVFRRLLECFAYPGQIKTIAEADALTAVLATLVDGATCLADPQGLVAAPIWSLLGVKRAEAQEADFVVVDGQRYVHISPRLGTLESPERSATLILRVSTLGEGMRYRLAGPGIAETGTLRLHGLHPTWLEARAGWVVQFPLGVDMILVDACRVAALPRTLTLGPEEGG